MASEIFMQLLTSDASDKIRGLVSASLQKLANISKPQVKFLLTIFELWLELPVRYTMLNLSPFSRYLEKSIRLHFEQLFDFTGFQYTRHEQELR